MNTIKPTYRLVHAAATDAGNRSMRDFIIADVTRACYKLNKLAEPLL